MNTNKAGFIAGALFVPVAVLSSGTAYAQDFPRTVAAAQLSVTRGFTQLSLPLLHRTAAVDSAKASALLLEKLCPAPCPNAGHQPGSCDPGRERSLVLGHRRGWECGAVSRR